MRSDSPLPLPIMMKWNEVTKRTLVKLRNKVKRGSNSPNRDEAERSDETNVSEVEGRSEARKRFP